MTAKIEKIISIVLICLLGAAIVGIIGIYAKQFIFTPASGTKQLQMNGNSQITSVSVDYTLDGMGGYVKVQNLSETSDEINHAAGIVGDAVNITASRRSVEEATITFSYDKSATTDEEAKKLGIAYYNEETGRMELLNSTVNLSDGSVSVKTNHFSEYVVVDTDEWYDSWLESQLRIRSTDSTDYFDIVFAIDNSSSMSGEKNELSREAVYDFICELYDSDMFSLISFNSSAKVLIHSQSYGDTDKSSLKDTTESIKATGGTSINAALEASINELDRSDNAEKQRLIILLSDGQSSVDESYFKEAEAKQIKIITIGFGNDADEEMLQNIASNNSGKYYKANEKTVKEIFELIREEYLGIDLSVDSDGDGLPDKIETTGMRTQYGYIIRTDPYSADTDGDGISDGEEMGTFVEDENVSDTDKEYGLTAYRYFRINSNPLIADNNTDDGEYRKGDYPITFRTDMQDYDLTYDFYYADDFFEDISSKYNRQLAIASLGITMSAFSTRQSDDYWAYDNVYIASGSKIRREDNIVNAYETLGFVDARFYNYDVTLNDSSNKAAFSFARKVVGSGDDAFTLITVIVRGGGYGAEWASNFDIGDNGIYHEGFNTASWEIVHTLMEYMADLRIAGKLKNDQTVKFWVTGFSRGAAVANLTAAKLDKMSSIDSKNVFAYTFATPQGVNLDKATTYAGGDYAGIFNIINPGDVVPTVALSEWGFGRFGTDVTLPTSSDLTYETKQTAAELKFTEITGSLEDRTMVSTVMQTGTINKLDKLLYNLAASTDEYNKDYRDFIVAVLEFLYTKEYVTTEDGSTQEADVITKFTNKYGEDGLVALYEAQSYVWNKKDTMDETDNLIWVITAFAVMYDIDIDSIGSDSLEYISGDLTSLGIIGWVVSLMTSDVAGAHYPEVYLSWLYSM